jgi:2-polyprenyl-3-methyl-5-hydroxy-6-metoxy-1,4-benzoquinol methylase
MVDERLIRHLLACSDVEGALWALSTIKENCPWSETIESYIFRHWPQSVVWPEKTIKAAHEAIYAEAGRIEAALPGVFWTIPQGLRYQLLRDFLAARPGRAPFRLLDYGCSRGFFSTHLTRLQPRGIFVGLDIDQTSVNQANAYAQVYAPDVVKEGRLWFDQGTSEDGWRLSWGDDGFDYVVLMEILEHVPDAKALLDWAWDRLLPDGQAFVTVPLGPVEYLMWLREPHRKREHIRELREDTLRLMFLGARDVEVQTYETGECPVTGLKVGTTVATFRKSETRPTFARDLSAVLSVAVPEGARLSLPT